MQQYSEQDPGTLYREDAMAPGCTHEPMYDHDCLYPWHQYETITRAIFQATEMQFSRHQEEETAGYHPLRRE